MSSQSVSLSALLDRIQLQEKARLRPKGPPPAPKAHPPLLLRDHPPAHSDPVIQAIDRMIEPRWIEGSMHVQRLRALADCEALTHHPDVSAWLRDLANIIAEMA